MLLLFAGLQVKLWPWRTDFANYSDLWMNFGLLLCMMGASFLVDIREMHGERVLGEFLFVGAMMVFFVAFVVIGRAGYLRLRSFSSDDSWKWGVFICHHKGGAAVL